MFQESGRIMEGIGRPGPGLGPGLCAILAMLCLVDVLAIAIFANGFFPQPSRLEAHSGAHPGSGTSGTNASGHPEEAIRDTGCSSESPQEPGRKLVLVIIDAWRSGFYFPAEGSGRSGCQMPFLCDLQRARKAMAFEALVQTPTVTMPRIKALTTGTVPSFRDVLLNFASTEIGEDNLVDRFREVDRRILFCGDDTWLRLYPSRFVDGSEGTVSFFVTDYTEVDDNVTRCAERKLRNPEDLDDWDVMILHYLGLDHIGHSLGGDDRMLAVKLAEMDDILREIYATLKKFGTDFWLVVSGDHGMTEAGSHGGSSGRETRVPLIIVDGSGSFSGQDQDQDQDRDITRNEAPLPIKPVAQVQQIDLVPTLAYLFNIRIPVNSIGVTMIPRLFGDPEGVPELSSMSGSTDEGSGPAGLGSEQGRLVQILESILQNANQLLGITPGNEDADLLWCIESSTQALRHICLGKGTNHRVNGTDSRTGTRRVIGRCTRTLQDVQQDLLERQTTFNLSLITTATLMALMVLFICLAMVLRWYKEMMLDTFGGILMVLQMAIFLGSSLVEEEHDVQYFFLTSILMVMAAGEVRRLYGNYRGQNRHQTGRLATIGLVAVAHRLCRTFTEGTRRRWLMEGEDLAASGQKYDARSWYTFVTSSGAIFSQDASQILKNSAALSVAANLATFALILMAFIHYRSRARSLSRSRSRSRSRSGAQLPELTGLRQGSDLLSIGLAVGTYGLMAWRNLFGLSEPWDRYVCWTVYSCCATQLLIFAEYGMAVLQLLALLQRPCQFPLVGLQMTVGLVEGLARMPPHLVWFSAASAFFYAGNSNSLSTVDVSVGYTCASGYQPVIVALQLLLSTYSGPLSLLVAWHWSLAWLGPGPEGDLPEIREADARQLGMDLDYLNCAGSDADTSTRIRKEALGGFQLPSPYRNRTVTATAIARTVPRSVGSGVLFYDDSTRTVPLLYLCFCFSIFSRIFACLLALLLHRHHLFVWSVFAPKFLYETVHLLIISAVLILIVIVNWVTK